MEHSLTFMNREKKNTKKRKRKVQKEDQNPKKFECSDTLYFLLMKEWIVFNSYTYTLKIKKAIQHWNAHLKSLKYPKNSTDALDCVKKEILQLLKEDMKVQNVNEQEKIENLYKIMEKRILRSSYIDFYCFETLSSLYEWLPIKMIRGVFVQKIWKKEHDFFLNLLQTQQKMNCFTNLKLLMWCNIIVPKSQPHVQNVFHWLIITNKRNIDLSLELQNNTQNPPNQEIVTWFKTVQRIHFKEAACCSQSSVQRSLPWLEKKHSIFQLNLGDNGFNIWTAHIRIEPIVVFFCLEKNLYLDVINLIMEYVFGL